MADYDKITQLKSDPVSASVGPVDKAPKNEPVVQATGQRVPTFWQNEVTHAKAAVKKTWKTNVIPTVKSMLYQAISSVFSAIIFQDDATAMAAAKSSTPNTLRVNYGGMFGTGTTQTGMQKTAPATTFTDNIILSVGSKEEADMLKEAISGCIEKYGFASSRALYEMAGLAELAKPIDENYGWKREALGKIVIRMLDGEWRISMPPRTAR